MNVAKVKLYSDGGCNLLQVDVVTQLEIAAKVFPDGTESICSRNKVESLHESVCFCIKLLLLPRAAGIVSRDVDVEVIFAGQSPDQVFWLFSTETSNEN